MYRAVPTRGRLFHHCYCCSLGCSFDGYPWTERWYCYCYPSTRSLFYLSAAAIADWSFRRQQYILAIVHFALMGLIPKLEPSSTATDDEAAIAPADSTWSDGAIERRWTRRRYGQCCRRLGRRWRYCRARRVVLLLVLLCQSRIHRRCRGLVWDGDSFSGLVEEKNEWWAKEKIR